MKAFGNTILISLLMVLTLGLLYLTNTGVLSFDQTYVYRIPAELPDPSPVVAFENVHVVPVDEERVLEGQTVLVRDGIIEQVGDTGQVEIPPEAQVIDGSGQYLMPGLVDMHVHIEDANDMLPLVANGVTSVRNLWGNTGKKLLFGLPDQLELRRQIKDGAAFGPTIYTAGPVMEGSPSFHPMAEVFDTPEAAAESVRWQKAQGYDFIKVYDHLSPEVYAAIITAAKTHDMPVVGHAPKAVGLDGVLASGQSTIEHMSGYVDPDPVTFLIPDDQLEAYAERTRDAGVWNVVTLSEYPRTKETPAGLERLQQQPAMAYVAPFMNLMTPFLYSQMAKSHTYAGADYPDRIADLNRQMVQTLHGAGAGILLGTDAAQPYHVPGFAIHDELAMLVDAGLSPYEAIEAGTRNAALAMGKLDEFGTLEPGKRADMILLEGNPLDDVANIQQRAGVMLRGRWLPEAQLQGLLEGLVASYEPSILERLWPLALIAVAIGLQRWRGRDNSVRQPHD